MKVLISPLSLEEAHIVAEGGCDILDIKNVKEGSLGAQSPWVIQEIVDAFKGNDIICSATLGDLPQKPGTASLAAFGVANCGVNYVKAGLYGSKTYEDALEMMQHIQRAVRLVSNDILVVASGYADFRRFGGVSCADVVAAARDSHCDVVMLDTAIKDGKTLLDAMTMDEIQNFIESGHEAGLLVALAGSVTEAAIGSLARLGPDIIGVRGAVCDSNDRTRGITMERVRSFMEFSRQFSTGEEKFEARVASVAK